MELLFRLSLDIKAFDLAINFKLEIIIIKLEVFMNFMATTTTIRVDIMDIMDIKGIKDIMDIEVDIIEVTNIIIMVIIKVFLLLPEKQQKQNLI